DEAEAGVVGGNMRGMARSAIRQTQVVPSGDALLDALAKTMERWGKVHVVHVARASRTCTSFWECTCGTPVPQSYHAAFDICLERRAAAIGIRYACADDSRSVRRSTMRSSASSS